MVEHDQPLQVYLAGRYSRKKEFQKYRAEMKLYRIECTSQWLDEPDTNTFEGSTAEALRAHALRDIKNVAMADVLVLFTHERRTIRSGGGRFVEFGIAVARGSAVLVVGPPENIFCHLPGVWRIDTWADALVLLTRPRMMYKTLATDMLAELQP